MTGCDHRLSRNSSIAASLPPPLCSTSRRTVEGLMGLVAASGRSMRLQPGGTRVVSDWGVEGTTAYA
jgi:hypothetical protein